MNEDNYEFLYRVKKANLNKLINYDFLDDYLKKQL